MRWRGTDANQQAAYDAVDGSVYLASQCATV